MDVLGLQYELVCSVNTRPTLCRTGFNVETVEYKNISFTVWDVGGQDKVCPLIVMASPVSCSFPADDAVNEQPALPADPPSLEALLPEHTGPYIRRG